MLVYFVRCLFMSSRWLCGKAWLWYCIGVSCVTWHVNPSYYSLKCWLSYCLSVWMSLLSVGVSCQVVVIVMTCSLVHRARLSRRLTRTLNRLVDTLASLTVSCLSAQHVAVNCFMIWFLLVPLSGNLLVCGCHRRQLKPIISEPCVYICCQKLLQLRGTAHISCRFVSVDLCVQAVASQDFTAVTFTLCWLWQNPVNCYSQICQVYLLSDFDMKDCHCSMASQLSAREVVSSTLTAGCVSSRPVRRDSLSSW